ncbi:MAG: helix-turn-helix transcriptional regulator, partial [Clostridia bacterium]|nr:helix-turn-helix transcriptional regulator [Clostridia bacterium]
MKTVFNISQKRKIDEANSNIYLTPAMHPTRTMPLHDLVYMISGTWQIGQEGETLTVGKDDVFVLSANRHHYKVSPCSQRCRTIYIHAHSLEGDYSTMEESVAPSSDAVVVNSVINASASPDVKELFIKIANSKNAGDELLASSYFDLLVCLLSELSSQDKQKSLAQKIHDLIILHPDCFFSNREIAEKLHISVRTAEKAFKAYYKTSIHQYILKNRIEQSKHYLINYPDMKISEIADNLGFYDEYHFSNQFKKHASV